MIYTSLDDFYLSAAQLEASPSRLDGVSAELESQLRRYACDAIAEAVVQLHLPQSVACTAQVLLQRFYCKRSLTQFDVKILAIACFWLAAKLEEVIEIDSPNRVRLRYIIVVFYRVFRRSDGKYLDILEPGTQRYDALKTEVVRAERHILRAFGFIVNVEHPHRFVLVFGQLLGLTKEVLQEGWNLANDSLRTTLCVQHKAEVVACGLLFLATRRQGVPMPESPPWWQVFGVRQEQLLSVASTITALATLPKATYVLLTGRDFTSRAENGRASPPLSLPPVAPPPQSQQAAAEVVEIDDNGGGGKAAPAAAAAALKASHQVAVIDSAATTTTGGGGGGDGALQQQEQDKDHHRRRHSRSAGKSRSRSRERDTDRDQHRRRRNKDRRQSRSRSRSRTRRRHRSRSTRSRSRERRRYGDDAGGAGARRRDTSRDREPKRQWR